MDASTPSVRAPGRGIAAVAAIVAVAVAVALTTGRKSDDTTTDADAGIARVADEPAAPIPPSHTSPEIGDGRFTRAPTTTAVVPSTTATAPTTAPPTSRPPSPDGPAASPSPSPPPASTIPPSSTAVPVTAPPTSSTTTPTTTVAVTTTTGPEIPGALTQAYLGSQGESAATWLLPVTAGPRYASLPNYDTDVDDDPGRTIRRTSGDQVAKDQAQLWAISMPEAGRLTATPRLEIWVAAVGFDPAASAAVTARVAVCRGYFTTCDELGTATGAFDQADFGEGFGRLVISLPPVDEALEADELLAIGVAVPASSGSDVWLAFDTASHPSRVHFD